MWLSFSHDAIAAEGYRQTGPLLPDDSVVDDLYYSLRPFWDKLGGDQLRQTAYEHVQSLWDSGQLTSWADAELVIEQHSAHDPIDEGLEGVEWDVGRDGETDDSADCGDDDDDEDDGDDADGDDGADLPGDGTLSDSGGPGIGDDSGRGRGHGDEPPSKKARGGDIEWGGICHDPEFIRSLEVVVDVAKRTQDDKLLRVVSDRLSQSSAKQKAMNTPTAEELRKTARLQMEEMQRERDARAELRRRASMDDLAARATLEETKERAAHARKEAMEAARKLRQEVADRKDSEATKRAEARWLQTVYPVDLARRLLTWRQSLSDEQLAKLKAAVALVRKTGRCDRDTAMPDLWTPVNGLTNIIGHERGAGKAKIPIRCCKEFEWILFGNAWKAGSPHDALWMMRKLVGKVCPSAEDLFMTRFGFHVILSATDGVLEQTFIYAVILLSKWLGRERFPMGVHDWPPEQMAASSSSAVAAPSSSSAVAASSSAVAASSSAVAASSASAKKR